MLKSLLIGLSVISTVIAQRPELIPIGLSNNVEIIETVQP